MVGSTVEGSGVLYRSSSSLTARCSSSLTNESHQFHNHFTYERESIGGNPMCNFRLMFSGSLSAQTFALV